MLLPITLSAETTYATKGNIVYPGSQAQATAAEALAQTRVTDFVTSPDFGIDAVTITIGAGAIEIGG